MTFHFAWVAATETVFDPAVHSREDEDVFAFDLEHTEGDFAMLTVDIRNPRRSLLTGGSYWLHFSVDGTALFFGRLIAAPEEIAEEIVRLNFIARPADYVSRKETLANTLKVAPYWDPVWIAPERQADADAVLEARTQIWHIDRVTHELTVSDIIQGEAPTLTFGEDDFDYSSLQTAYGAPPVRRVRVDAEISWDQTASGTVDVSRRIGTLASYTGQGLEEDWPSQGQSLGGGWRVEEAHVTRLDGISRPSQYIDVPVDSIKPVDPAMEGSLADSIIQDPFIARFYKWEFNPTLVLSYDVSRRRIERLFFELVGDVQQIFAEPGEEEVITLGLSSQRVVEPLDGGAMPIGDLTSRAYLRTVRGQRSISYLIALARAKMWARARAVEISFAVPFEAGIPLSCRHNVTINDSRLPNGTATGKVIAYRLVSDGEGRSFTEITVGCAIGTGSIVAAAAGTPSYVDESYSAGGYQYFEGATVEAVPDVATFGDQSSTLVSDDGVDFRNMTPTENIVSLEVRNDASVQSGLINKRFPDVPAAVETLNANHTEIWLELRPLTGGPFETDYLVPVSPVAIPRTIVL